jgi:hypothetical protein
VDDLVCSIVADDEITGQYGEVMEDCRSDYTDPPSFYKHSQGTTSHIGLLSSLAYATNPHLLYLGEYDSGQSFSSIDLGHIKANEGYTTEVIVPPPGDGYTIGVGVNLSAQSQNGLLNMGVDPATVNAVASVIGVWPPNGSTDRPGISLSDTAATQLSMSVLNAYFNAVGSAYSNTCTFENFTALPTEGQTAIGDLQCNLPGGIQGNAPNLWTQITTGNWQAAIDNLSGTKPPFSSKDALLNKRAAGDAALPQKALNAGTLPHPEGVAFNAQNVFSRRARANTSRWRVATSSTTRHGW